MPLISFDPKLIDLTKVDAAIDDAVAAASPAIGGTLATPARGLLTMGATAMKATLHTWLAQVKIVFTSEEVEQEHAHWEQQVKLVFAENAGTYLAGFNGVPAQCSAYVSANPEVIRKLKAKKRDGTDHFTKEQQEKILGKIDWLELLQTVGPVLFKILMAFLL